LAPVRRAPDAHRLERHACTLGGGVFELFAVIAEALDQADDQIVRTGMRNVLHHRRHVNHAVALEDAELEIIEK
jgi:hypothetical protein